MTELVLSESTVEYIDHMGTDKTVVNAARVSFANDDPELKVLTQKDEKLIKYLAVHNHWSPFAHTSIQFKVKAPIFVARQLVKHFVGSAWNEVSRRYVDFNPEFYIPTAVRPRPINSKQGSGDGELELSFIDDILRSYESSLKTYDSLIKQNVAPEMARIVLPLGCMTDWYWTGSLVFWARVYKLRTEAHAQKETADVAYQIGAECEKLFPVSWKALIDG